ncbi:MAG: hypothetical protein ABIG39_01115 [Candidatus Micrarchaeota archaeon]
MNKIPRDIFGAAGAYYVAAELSRQGIIASLTVGNTRFVDILVSSSTGNSASIQVKTSHLREWRMDKKHEESSDDLFYVLVYLDKNNAPEYYVISSPDVRSIFKNGFDRYNKKRLEKGKTKKDTRDRKLRYGMVERYKDNWKIIEDRLGEGR